MKHGGKRKGSGRKPRPKTVVKRVQVTVWKQFQKYLKNNLENCNK